MVEENISIRNSLPAFLDSTGTVSFECHITSHIAIVPNGFRSRIDVDPYPARIKINNECRFVRRNAVVAVKEKGLETLEGTERLVPQEVINTRLKKGLA